VCFAHLGHDVVCADIDAAKMEMLQRGEVPILEDRLEQLLLEGLRRRRLRFTVDIAHAVGDAEFVCLCVPTPFGAEGAADLTCLRAACTEIGPLVPSGAIIMTKSTVPVGTTRIVEQIVHRTDVTVISNPEFLREGFAIHDFLRPDRIVIGSDDEQATVRVASLYLGVAAPIIVTDSVAAETIKYAANSFLAMKISFVNAIATICEAVGADVADVVRGVGYDHRIGPDCLRPGPGWGGSCLPKDVAALLSTAHDAGYEFELLRSAVAVNDQQRSRVVDKVRTAVGGDLHGRRIAVWGLTFKADTNDLRDSPALDVIALLRGEGATIVAYDPSVTDPIADLEVVADPYGACDGAHALVLMTEWQEFERLDLEKVAHLLVGNAVVDARNMLDPLDVRAAGLSYQGIGR
jgi:UDPglucose 6-dehydrogenase